MNTTLRYSILALIVLAMALGGCAKWLPPVKIDRQPAPADYSRLGPPLSAIPRYDAQAERGWQVDLRSKNLGAIDASASLDDLMFATFDDRTVWPAAGKIPAGYDHQRIMELGKDPGLGVRTLHSRGVTGKNIGIAIIDQTLLVEHGEYADRLRLFEENGSHESEAAMHAPAVASIAVGKTVGVAPEADLYFIACSLGSQGAVGGWTYDFTLLAASVRRILRLNDELPAERKIRVISISVGWMKGQKAYEEISAAVGAARRAGVFVVSSSMEESYGFGFDGLGREPLADPNAAASYTPGLFLAKRYLADDAPARLRFSNRLWIPMDSRTSASPTGKADFVFYREGGWSWCIPYIAGVYALACQVHPGLTPELFWELAMKTGTLVQVPLAGKARPLGPIIDPLALIAALENH